ncbi:neutral/alkaline non-lysosomal ceramidase C-terminal domain-containing protein [Leptospira sanjuanensis]|uniref:neutral/alkaline non-lysosomal ceramidase C-terminal domain-containing protein n=1 Tax=Leptospira sanjuanensis TaxID=2879643 RepID=UPI001EE8D182|nr:neutral/alkaline non-lysosomal ceramidase C-terminal domain-containing protein [Leptospira sanjuanensis]MCG6169130.1 neutral/alkaline non-lysosomal ceramidase C-terminal domain-containing protein [Leptospira sanjuanensis]
MGDSSPNQPNPADITKPFLRPNDLDPNLDALENPIVHGAQWTTIATDNNPYTAFDWVRTGGDLSPTSEVTITWLIRNQSQGTYRIVYNGLAKQFWVFFWTYKKVTGISKEFILQ